MTRQTRQHYFVYYSQFMLYQHGYVLLCVSPQPACMPAVTDSDNSKLCCCMHATVQPLFITAITVYTVTQKKGTKFLLCAFLLILDRNW